MPRIGIVLSGCGVYDGAEIHEAVLSMYYLKKYGNELLVMAPNVDQAHVVNHLTGEVEQGQKRNVLVESARIARGDIKDIANVTADDFDALVFPGGFGAAKNLVTFAFDGADCKILPDVKRLIKETVEAKKPLAAVCIAPVVVAKALEDSGLKAKLTIGNDNGTAVGINIMGAEHIETPVKEVLVDSHLSIITNPAYMLAADIAEVGEAIKKTMQTLTGMLNNISAGC
ncbi:isoprenoid biosynthesis glyoxalase ElbB [Seleniivibrio woodruffii]|uniref:Enhancing lycopene biosynthesis protein 2 n=1 Tax=Seleniivibrio woodruffii TaxID=1078050 RepID=A0A4R1KBC0_9BACT|nr:isoprenoid biosynthesis glyoxalase ElbB [Seleniivibrio woodruffii]TCK60449.1 enhancing lycopene biosynthesis protein 2 [Seleniivibrio woodruffii]TVZ36077.1 enhancing lycopene biosynthesis protein 2 [Seleniivibrio woodruffii]